MNKVLAGIVVVLAIAVAFLFYKVYAPATVEKKDQQKSEKAEEPVKPAPKKAEMAGTAPTGRFAYVNIDRLNEESLEVSDLVKETKRRKGQIEAAVENLQMQYQKKIQDYQMAAKAGIAPASEMQSQEREIMRLEKEAQEKQLQMDNLSMEITEKNNDFQKAVRSFLQKWNNGRYDFVFSYSEVVPTMLLGNASLEVTDEVVAELNREYKQRKGLKK